MLIIAGEYDPVTGKKIKKGDKKKTTRPGDEGPGDYEYVCEYNITSIEYNISFHV